MADTGSNKTVRSTFWPQMEADAARRGVSVSALVNLLMGDYLNGEVWVAVKRKAENTPERFQSEQTTTRPAVAQQPAAAPVGASLEAARSAMAEAEGAPRRRRAPPVRG